MTATKPRAPSRRFSPRLVGGRPFKGPLDPAELSAGAPRHSLAQLQRIGVPILIYGASIPRWVFASLSKQRALRLDWRRLDPSIEAKGAACHQLSTPTPGSRYLLLGARLPKWADEVLSLSPPGSALLALCLAPHPPVELLRHFPLRVRGDELRGPE